MSSNWSIDYSVSFSSAAKEGSPPPPAEQRWAFDDCGVVTNDAVSVVVIGRSTGRRAVISNPVFHAMLQCQEFASHEEQLAKIRRGFPSLPVGDVEEAIAGLRRIGLIVEQQDLLARMGGAVGGGDPCGGIDQVMIGTCDRPELLRRLLQSCADNERRHGRKYRYLVVDDSRQAENGRRNRRLVADAVSELGLQVSYHGQEEIDGLVGRVLTLAPELEQAARFLLLGEPDWRRTYGRTWNRALLLARGNAIVKVDDDVLVRVCRPSMAGEARCVVGGPPKRAYFLEHAEQWQEYLDPDERDPFAELGRYIGGSFGEVLKAQGPRGAPRLQRIGTRALRDISAGSRVLVAGCGYIGDPGTASNGWLYELGDEDRRMLVRSEADYQRFRRDRNLWFGHHEPTLSPGYTLISGVTAIDNRARIPPYFPLLRNEDFLFGGMMQFLHPQSLMMEHDWAVPHLPEPRRRWDTDATEVPGSMGALAFAVGWLARWRSLPESAALASRESGLVAALRDLVEVDPRRLQQLLDEEFMQMRAAKIRFRQEDMAAFPDAPDYWRRDMERSIQNNLAAIHSQDPSVLYDLRDEAGPGSGLARFRDLFARYADAFEQWDTLREAAAHVGP